MAAKTRRSTYGVRSEGVTKGAVKGELRGAVRGVYVRGVRER
jgi:hypothetical protein